MIKLHIFYILDRSNISFVVFDVIIWLRAQIKKKKCVADWCRAAWEVLEAVIGQLDEPFKVTLIYSSCLGENGATVALDSLELINCESGTLILFCFK